MRSKPRNVSQEGSYEARPTLWAYGQLAAMFASTWHCVAFVIGAVVAAAEIEVLVHCFSISDVVISHEALQ